MTRGGFAAAGQSGVRLSITRAAFCPLPQPAVRGERDGVCLQRFSRASPRSIEPRFGRGGVWGGVLGVSNPFNGKSNLGRQRFGERMENNNYLQGYGRKCP